MMRIVNEAAGAAAYAQTMSATQNPQGAKSARSAEKSREAGGAFDQVDISKESSGESGFRKELAARLVRDVRASASIGGVQQVREQLHSGAYQLDPISIAKAMLLER